MTPMRPALPALALGLVLTACQATTDGRDPCAANPCRDANRTTCVAEGAQARCLCDPGFLPRPTGVCEPVSTANCPEHAGDGAEPDDCLARARDLGTSGTTHARTVEPPGDYDFFTLAATRGEVYVLTASADGALAPRADLFDAGGVWLAASEDPRRAQLAFKARVTGGLYVRVSHSPLDPSPGTGPYTLTYAALGPEDHGDGPTDATVVTADTGTSPRQWSGRFEYPGDQDWFSLLATAGVTYVLRFDPARGLPVTAVYADASATRPAVYQQSSEVRFTPPTSGTLYLALEPARGESASYGFTLQR